MSLTAGHGPSVGDARSRLVQDQVGQSVESADADVAVVTRASHRLRQLVDGVRHPASENGVSGRDQGRGLVRERVEPHVGAVLRCRGPVHSAIRVHRDHEPAGGARSLAGCPATLHRQGDHLAIDGLGHPR